ncbi:hypothetical protein AB751O23_AD_00360 [Chlamydiales bacterium SCGC AB-751-O23]|jgi:hypothetical protein|nr:hypothetical protein AB751O23_AD_00360 [Chlamydiales bacterium SCGC AB-751-O23]
MKEAKAIISDVLKKFDKLLHNQTRLNSLSLSFSSPYPLEALQSTQETLIDEISSLRKQLSQSITETDLNKESLWKEVGLKVDSFQKLNKSFTDVLSVKKGLIKKELDELKNAKNALFSMKKIYVNQNANLSKSKRLDTLL